MDFAKCVEILNNRSQQQHEESCPCCTQTPTKPLNSSSNIPEIESTEHQSLISFHERDWADMSASIIRENSEISALSSLALVQQVLQIQHHRIKLYHFYDQELQTLLIHNKLDIYPQLCTKMTAYFSELSSIMLAYKTEAELRQMKSLESAITGIQKAEKDKLLYIAALHLDQMQSRVPSLENAMGGPCGVQKAYLQKKIKETEGIISEEVENVQGIKLDLMEDS